MNIADYLPSSLPEFLDACRTWLIKSLLSPDRRRDLYMDMANQIDANIEIKVTMETILETERATARGIGGMLLTFIAGEPTATAVVARNVKQTLESGQNYIQGFRPYIPPEEFMLVAAGAETMANVEALRTATAISTQRAQVRRQFLALLQMPLLNFILIYGLLLGAYTKFIPLLTAYLPAERWTGSAADAYAMASFVGENHWTIIIGLTVAGVGTWISLPNLTGPIRTALDKFPPWSVYREAVGIQTIYTVAIALSARTQQLTTILANIENNSTPYLASRIQPARQLMEAYGYKLGEAFRQTGLDFPDPALAYRLGRYDGHPDYQSILATIATNWLDAYVRRMDRAAKTISGLAMLITATVLTMLMTGIYDATGQMTDLIH